jgi:hypothetical protein
VNKQVIAMTDITNRPNVYHRRHKWLTEAVLIAGIVVFGSYAFVVDGRLASTDIVGHLTHLIR